jgi:DNA-binding response OmpR family regulator
MKILLVEDDQSTGLALTEILGSHRYTVNLATDGQTGLGLAQSFDYDLLVVDVMIPQIDGISLCRQLRQKGYQRPILLLTAKDSSTDRILGLDAGADDYVAKPFDPEELLARIRALLRRGQSIASAKITWENVEFDSTTGDVTCNGQPVRLTPKENCLLELLLLNPKRIFSRRAILDRLWDFANAPGEETVSTHIKCLRQKLKAAGATDLIETVHGLGYRLRQPSSSRNSQPKPDEASESIASSIAVDKAQASRQRVRNRTAKLLEQFRSRFIDQWQVLEQAAIALNANHLSLELQQQAKQEAHKLAGSLGIFGLEDGSQFAKELEEALEKIGLDRTEAAGLIKLVRLLRQELDKTPEPVSDADAAYSPLILIIDDDLALAERVRVEAIAWGLRVEVATDLQVARRSIEQSPPDAILLDLNFPQPHEDGLSFLQELVQHIPRIPVLAFTRRGSLSDRLQVVRLGGCVFLQKPLPTYEILKSVTDVLKQQQTTHTNRVMIVDDDTSTINTLAQALQPLGVEVTELENPAEFWQVLTSSAPNLLILDLELPGFQGVELCQAVRSDPQWRHLPILFLSAQTDATQIDRAFAVGADDYLSKATDSSELTTRIIRRLRRTGFQETKAAQDGCPLEPPTKPRQIETLKFA